jgi:hydroxyacylglutathione hydrolase
MEPVITIPALGDNFIYLYHYRLRSAFVVDPGDAGPVLKALEKFNLNLTHALATHHHSDHTAGIDELKTKTGSRVIAGEKAEILRFDDFLIKIIAAPGHTRDSVCYYVPPSQSNSGVLFTGDTLFIGGCGRPMECDASVMWDSLRKIASLPDDTLVYPGHDYTEENYQFALTIEPDNKIVQQCLRETKESRESGKLTVPSTIGREKVTNVFLRSAEPKIKTILNMPNASPAEVFAELRRRKNIFG